MTTRMNVNGLLLAIEGLGVGATRRVARGRLAVLAAVILALSGHFATAQLSVAEFPEGAAGPPEKGMVGVERVGAPRAFLELATGSRGAQGEPAKILIVRSFAEPSDLGGICEDFQIMSRILQKGLSEEVGTGRVYNVGRYSLSFDLGAVSRRLSEPEFESIYLEGYGALFLTKVDFPLVAPSEQAAEEVPSGIDPMWESTRREIYEPDRSAAGAGWMRRVLPQGLETAAGYDAGKVEKLQETLLESLKHASNIRALKPQDSIAIAVTGASSTSAGAVSLAVPGDSYRAAQEMLYAVRERARRAGAEPRQFSADDVAKLRRDVEEARREVARAGRELEKAEGGMGNSTQEPVLDLGGSKDSIEEVKEEIEEVRREIENAGKDLKVAAPGVVQRVRINLAADSTSGAAAVLTIHVKKADVDAFAQGELSYEDFCRKAAIVIY